MNPMPISCQRNSSVFLKYMLASGMAQALDQSGARGKIRVARLSQYF
jgi:hypothetical protein